MNGKAQAESWKPDHHRMSQLIKREQREMFSSCHVVSF